MKIRLTLAASAIAIVTLLPACGTDTATNAESAASSVGSAVADATESAAVDPSAVASELESVVASVEASVEGTADGGTSGGGDASEAEALILTGPVAGYDLEAAPSGAASEAAASASAAVSGIEFGGAEGGLEVSPAECADMAQPSTDGAAYSMGEKDSASILMVNLIPSDDYVSTYADRIEKCGTITSSVAGQEVSKVTLTREDVDVQGADEAFGVTMSGTSSVSLTETSSPISSSFSYYMVMAQTDGWTTITMSTSADGSGPDKAAAQEAASAQVATLG